MVESAAAISTRGVSKAFGDVRALVGVDIDVARGTVLGLLGPGFDVVRDAAKLREQIGLAGQYAAIDENLTGLENLTMVGRLYGMSRAAARARGEELLERFELVEAARRPTKTYRLDLAAALVAKPPVLFLDEPTRALTREAGWHCGM